MLESLRDLEQSIEKFQNNVTASNELNDLLRGVIEQAKTTNDSFNSASGELLTKISEMPDAIREQNNEHGAAIHEDLEQGLGAALEAFKEAQQQYIDSIESAKTEIAGYTEKAGELPEAIGAKNTEFAELVKQGVDSGYQEMAAAFKAEQENYTAELKMTGDKIKEAQELAESSLSAAMETVQGESDKFAEELVRTQELLSNSEKNLEEKYNALLVKINEVGESTLRSVRYEIDQKMKSQTILIIIMAIITILIGGRFFF